MPYLMVSVSKLEPGRFFIVQLPAPNADPQLQGNGKIFLSINAKYNSSYTDSVELLEGRHQAVLSVARIGVKREAVWTEISPYLHV